MSFATADTTAACASSSASDASPAGRLSPPGGVQIMPSRGAPAPAAKAAAAVLGTAEALSLEGDGAAGAAGGSVGSKGGDSGIGAAAVAAQVVSDGLLRCCGPIRPLGDAARSSLLAASLAGRSRGDTGGDSSPGGVAGAAATAAAAAARNMVGVAGSSSSGWALPSSPARSWPADWDCPSSAWPSLSGLRSGTATTPKMVFRAPPTQPAADDACFLPLPSPSASASPPGGDWGDEAVGTGTVSTLGRAGDAARDSCSGAAGVAPASAVLLWRPSSAGLPSDKLLACSPAKGLPNPPGGLSARARRAAMRTFFSVANGAGAAFSCFSGAGGGLASSSALRVSAAGSISSASAAGDCDGDLSAGCGTKSSTSTIGEAGAGGATAGATAAAGSGSCGSGGGGGGGAPACGTATSTTTAGLAGARALGSSPVSALACPKTRSTSSKKRCSVAAAAPVFAAPDAARIASKLLCVTRRAVSRDASDVFIASSAACSSLAAITASRRAAVACGARTLSVLALAVHQCQKPGRYLGGCCLGLSSNLFVCTLGLGGVGVEFRGGHAGRVEQ